MSEMAWAQGGPSDVSFDVPGARGAQFGEHQNAEAAALRKSDATSAEPKSELQVTSMTPEQKPFVYQEFPKWKYHRTGKSVIVEDRDAEDALGEGWANSPAGPFMPPNTDPLHWFDQWELDIVTADARQKMRKALLNAHADVLDADNDADSQVRVASMKRVFDEFADAYVSDGLLTETVLTNDIPTLIYDAAVAGGWQTGTEAANTTAVARRTSNFAHER